jgi:glycosyltransferase involved in cell wall biosynthesis
LAELGSPMGAENVYFHVGRFGHPFFQEQLHAAPAGIAYRTAASGLAEGEGSTPRRIALQGARLRRVRGALEWLAIRGLSRSGYVRRTRLEPPSGCALIHSGQQLLKRSALPYVVDFECVEVFGLYQRVALNRPWARRRLVDALTAQSCRFLLPWSRAAQNGLEAALGSGAASRLLPKTVTVLPAIRPRATRPAQRDSGPLRVLFVGTAFEAKGGVEAIRATRQVRATQDVVLDLISDVPARWRGEIEEAAGITVHPWPAPEPQVQRLFQQADLLLFPSHMDTLGFVMLEAMAHGIPVLATRHFAVPELVEDGVSGVLIAGENLLYGEDGLCRFAHTLPPPRSFRRALAHPSEAYVTRLAGALARVAEERDLHERLAAGALARVVDGPLSVARRRESLGRVYRQALTA